MAGLEQTRKLPGYHDEPLHGRLAGTRSVRLSQSYRVYYVVKTDGAVQLVSVTAVDKHHDRG